jgi:hypothetical protein
MAYDRAAIDQRGVDAFTNFHLVEYTEWLTSDQVAEAMHRGLITDADILLREKVMAGTAGIPAAAETEGEADPETSSAMEGTEEQEGPQSSPADVTQDWPAWAAAAAAGAAGVPPAGVEGSTSGAASPASLAGEASPEDLALQLFECILQEGGDSPQSVLPAAQRSGSSRQVQGKAMAEAPTTPAGTPACGSSLDAAAAAMSPDAREELGPFLDQLRAFAA